MSNVDKVSVLTDAASPISVLSLMETVAEKAASQASHRAVKDTFFLLGVDLDDAAHVRSTRDTFLHMIDRFESRKQRRDTWKRSAASGFVSLIVAAVAAIAGLFAHSASSGTGH